MGVGERGKDSVGNHDVSTSGQRAPTMPFERADVHRGVPGEPDTALGAQHGTVLQVEGCPSGGGDSAILQAHRVPPFGT